ncbi:MAG: LOG family protein, partial [Oscillospiraceae bacterium]|nr:LOG family protein [Oscillospiraceae bacterium]
MRAEIITLRQLGRLMKPAALMNVGGYYDPLDALLDGAVREGFLQHRKEELYRAFEDAEGLVEYLEIHAISPG